MGGTPTARLACPSSLILRRTLFGPRPHATGYPPPPDQLRPKEVEPVGRALLILFPEIALGWIAFGYLTMKGAPPSRAAVQNLLINTSSTSNALFEAFARALDAIESNGQMVQRNVIARIIDAIEAYVTRVNAKANREMGDSRLARLASSANRTDVARLVAALLSLQWIAGPTDIATRSRLLAKADHKLLTEASPARAVTHRRCFSPH